MHEAHIGRARAALFDVAFERFQSLRRPAGLILTTDADSRPAPDWIAQTEAEIAAGVVGVGGRILLEPAERAALSPGVRRLFLLDIGYRRALEELRSLYAPEANDPFPRHHQHFGGSLAATAAAYAAAGGMPLQRSSEDVALYRAIVESGARFRHSDRVRVYTSARAIGRAEGGLADAISWWRDQVRAAAPVLVESAAAAEARLARLGLWCVDNPASFPPAALSVTPEPPPGQAAEIHATLRTLRERIEALRPLSPAARLDQARSRLKERSAVPPWRLSLFMQPAAPPKSLLVEPERHALLPPETAVALGHTVVVAPHPDDESLGCGGLLALLADWRSPAHVIVMTDGSRSHPNSPSYPAARLAALREQETLEALAALGLPARAARFLRYADCRLPAAGTRAFGKAVTQLHEMLVALAPDTILVPWRRDPHGDHEATWRLLREATAGMESRPRWLEYPVWAWTQAESEVAPQSDEGHAWRLDITPALARKEQAIARHRSQTGVLIHDDPGGFVLEPAMLAHFARPWELLIEPADG